MLKKLLCLVLMIITVSASAVCINASALSVDPEIQPLYEYTNDVDSLISLSASTKTATCTSKVKAKPNATKIVIAQKLQKKSGDTWVSLKKWTKTYYTTTATFSNSMGSLTSGTYRTKTGTQVYVGGDVHETIKKYSTTASF